MVGEETIRYNYSKLSLMASWQSKRIYRQKINRIRLIIYFFLLWVCLFVLQNQHFLVWILTIFFFIEKKNRNNGSVGSAASPFLINPREGTLVENLLLSFHHSYKMFLNMIWSKKALQAVTSTAQKSICPPKRNSFVSNLQNSWIIFPGREAAF